MVVGVPCVLAWYYMYSMACMSRVDCSYSVFPYGYSGFGCCVYTGYSVFYGDYRFFVGLCALGF